MHLEEFAVVHDAVDYVLDIVRQVGFTWHHGIQCRIHAVDRVRTRAPRRVLAIVLRQVREQLADHAAALAIVLRDEVAHAAGRVVRHGPAQLLLGHVLMGHGLDHVRPGDEHVARIRHHENEIRDRRRIDRAARARPHDRRDLRDHAAGQRIAQEDIGIPRERDDALLNARAAGIVEPDHRRSGLEREVHDLANLLRVGLRERPSEHREVLREDVHQPPMDAPVPGDETVAGNDLLVHAEIAAAVRHQLVQFFESVLIQQQFDALARAQFAFLVLPRAPLRPAPLLGGLMTAAKFVQAVHLAAV